MKRLRRNDTAAPQAPLNVLAGTHPLLVPELLDVILRSDNACGYRASRERDLFNFLLVSQTWLIVAAIVIEEELVRSDAPLYGSPYSENEEILREQLSVMQHQDWLIDPLIGFLAPRIFQPYRAAARANRILHVHCSAPHYLDDTTTNALALVMRFLELSKNRRYHNQLITVSPMQEGVVEYPLELLLDRWEVATEQIDPGVDNPFIVLWVQLEQMQPEDVEDILDKLASGRELPLPPGTNLIVLWQSNYTGYCELPLECLATTQIVMRRRMQIQGLTEEAINRINTRILLFANK